MSSISQSGSKVPRLLSSDSVVKAASSDTTPASVTPPTTGILKRKDSSTSHHARGGPAHLAIVEPDLDGVPHPHARKRSILRYDSFDAPESVINHSAHPHTTSISSRLRGVLKKDSSYDEGLRPILKYQDDHAVATSEVKRELVLKAPSTPSSSSAEDLSKNNPQSFCGVVIDPVPHVQNIQVEEECSDEGLKFASVSNEDEFEPRRSSTGSSRKASLIKERSSLIPPSSIKLSSDDRDLAAKLEKVAVKAEEIRRKQEMERIEGQGQIGTKEAVVEKAKDNNAKEKR